MNLFYFSVLLILSIELSVGNSVDVKTSSGTVRGQAIKVLNHAVNQFLGIPYAQPPVGSLRFRKPNPLSKPIEGIIDATKNKYTCWQQPTPLFGSFEGKLDFNEDCLFLNVWSQASEMNNPTKLLPVMLWIHGGGLSSGSVFQYPYNGSVLPTKDVVFVSINYRLGPFGFLYGGDESAPGNVGFFDQLLAIKWVRENIHLFGGDKQQITLFGESAGSWSISAHLLSPLSKGLFKRGIMESGALMWNKDRDVLSKAEAINAGKELAKHVKCTDDKQWLECLRKADPKEITKFNYWLTFPIFETEFLPLNAHKAFEHDKINKDVDIMAGVNKNEGSVLTVSFDINILKENITIDDMKVLFTEGNKLFHGLDYDKLVAYYAKNISLNDPKAMRWAIYAMVGDMGIKCPTYLFAKNYVKKSPKSNVYFYELTYESSAALKKLSGIDVSVFGVMHAADLFFVFGTPYLQQNIYNSTDIKFSEEVMNYWTDFAKHGKPSNNWPKFMATSDTKNSEILVKDLNPFKVNDIFKNPFIDSCDGFWKDYYLNNN